MLEYIGLPIVAGVSVAGVSVAADKYGFQKISDNTALQYGATIATAYLLEALIVWGVDKAAGVTQHDKGSTKFLGFTFTTVAAACALKYFDVFEKLLPAPIAEEVEGNSTSELSDTNTEQPVITE